MDDTEETVFQSPAPLVQQNGAIVTKSTSLTSGIKNKKSKKTSLKTVPEEKESGTGQQERKSNGEVYTNINLHDDGSDFEVL